MYSCVHRSKVHLYRLCTVVQYICTWIYIYKVLCLCVCPVYMICLLGMMLWNRKWLGLKKKLFVKKSRSLKSFGGKRKGPWAFPAPGKEVGFLKIDKTTEPRTNPDIEIRTWPKNKTVCICQLSFQKFTLYFPYKCKSLWNWTLSVFIQSWSKIETEICKFYQGFKYILKWGKA